MTFVNIAIDLEWVKEWEKSCRTWPGYVDAWSSNFLMNLAFGFPGMLDVLLSVNCSGILFLQSNNFGIVC